MQSPNICSVFGNAIAGEPQCPGGPDEELQQCGDEWCAQVVHVKCFLALGELLGWLSLLRQGKVFCYSHIKVPTSPSYFLLFALRTCPSV